MGRLRSISREPLVHFAMVGLALFGADRLRSPTEALPEPRVIRISSDRERELVESFRHRQGRDPSSAELERARQRWIEDEVLYREGVALGLAADDVLIKNRVVEKMRFVLSNSAAAREPTDDELRTFWQERRADYERPRRYDFEHLAVPGATRAEQRVTAERLSKQLSAGRAPEALGPEHQLFEGRSAENVTAMFGPSVEAALASLPRGAWHIVEGEPRQASRSRSSTTEPASTGSPAAHELHLFRVVSIDDATPPDFESHRAELGADWQRRERQRSAQQRLQQLRASWGVLEGGA